MSESDLTSALHANGDGSGANRHVRGRYAKFNGGMDVLLLEAMRRTNPFTAKHGTRLQMWHGIAETVGQELFKNPEAYSWHTCRDRVTALLKMYSDGKHDKLFKHGSVEENARKETILRELTASLARKPTKGAVTRSSVSLGDAKDRTKTTTAAVSAVNPVGMAVTQHALPSASPSLSAQAAPKRRKVDTLSSGAAAAGHRWDATGNSSLNAVNTNSINTNTAAAVLTTDGGDAVFRARVIDLMESKIQFDMEQRRKENELREQEFELQKRFLEYLQSK